MKMTIKELLDKVWKTKGVYKKFHDKETIKKGKDLDYCKDKLKKNYMIKGE
jgi:hypothetical protein